MEERDFLPQEPIGQSLSHQNVFKKAKRIRSAFTTNQILYLENEFLKSPYVSVVSRKEIAIKLNIPERAVKIWFQNRRMKEKKDVTHRPITELHHYHKTGHNGTIVNDQLSNVETLQSNNNLCSHSVLPQTKLKTSLNESTINNFLKKNHKQVTNTTKSFENKTTTDDVIVTHNFQNNTITSSSNEAKQNAELSIELLKKCKDHIHTNPMKKAVKTKTLQTKHNDLKKRKLNSQTLERKIQSSVTGTAPSIVKQQQTITQIPSGYIPLYPQQHNQQYSLPGNFLWKPMGPTDMSTIMPMCDFAILPNPHSISHPLTHSHIKSNDIQKSQCSCNCHMNPQTNTIAFSPENQPQYVIAVPFHKPPLQFSSPL
ncbi:PREDICTED: homeotic protein proboscipedia-like [Papilio polytes]|uniref:homeotic protein proboscipedia-like n=1 Tax=Papilio polytes TaxID=76194 RepID=UPI0006768D9B|nr:PREDICTED: homeotic protein proboscipedia-like [Papilio polytes]